MYITVPYVQYILHRGACSTRELHVPGVCARPALMIALAVGEDSRRARRLGTN